jgi:hypothetical protein
LGEAQFAAAIRGVHVRESLQCSSSLLRSLLMKALAENPHRPKGLFRMVAAAMYYSPC